VGAGTGGATRIGRATGFAVRRGGFVLGGRRFGLGRGRARMRRLAASFGSGAGVVTGDGALKAERGGAIVGASGSR
jgi:hypothetical protein